MVRKTKEEAEKTKERILDAAETVFSNQGVSGATMADIAETAGVSRGAVYGHYKSKTHVFLAMCDRMDRNFPSPETGIDPELRQADPLRFLRLAASAYMRTVLTRGSIRRFAAIAYFKCEYVGENEELLQYAQKLQRRRMEGLTRLIEDAVRKEQLPADLDISLAAQYFTCSIDGMLRQDLFHPDLNYIRLHVDRMLAALLDSMRHASSLRHSA